jgi:two-component system, cell cycle sensor histidine kinase and response regulator CckA
MRLTRRDAVIVATSGYSEDPVMARPRDFGFSDSIPKPYTESELRSLFSRLFP